MAISEETIQSLKADFQNKKSTMIQLEERKKNIEKQIEEAQAELRALGVANPDDFDIEVYEKEIIQLEDEIRENLSKLDEILEDVND